MDNMITCRVCSKSFDDDASLHKHIKAHKLLLAEYFQKYYPRYDKHSGEIIHWSSLEHYMRTDFNSRDNLRQWLLKMGPSARDYCRELLIKRKERKDLIWTPTQVELRTTMMPPVSWYDNLFGNYYELCEGLGFKNKFEPFNYWHQSIELNKRRKIFIDSREQNPLSLGSVKTEVKGLKYGDYSFSDAKWSGSIVIERKGLNDFIGTLSKGYERFQREIDRAVADGAYLIIIVEEILNKVVNFKSLSYLSSRIMATPEFILHRTRELLQKSPYIQFLFVRDHEEAAKTTEWLFTVGEEAKRYDLQMLLDIGKLYKKETL
jgi:hypothetical protein